MTTDYIDEQFEKIIKKVSDLDNSCVSNFSEDLESVTNFIRDIRDEITTEMEG